jgi:hypothetical protein
MVTLFPMLLSIIVSQVHYNFLRLHDLNSPILSNKPASICMIIVFPTIITLSEFFAISKVLLIMAST